ncbi:MAG: hypothetical protein PVF45_03955 [Anaerolineae bacterium]|jgi:hypothetical protein
MRQGSFSEFLVSPPPEWRGIVALLGFNVVGDLVAGLIGLATGNSMWFWIVGVLSILIFLLVIYWAWRRAEPLALVPPGQLPPKHRGLIVLVGTGRPGEDPMRQSAGAAIVYHVAGGQEAGLEKCWLVATTGEKGSLPIARQLEEECQAQNVEARIETVADRFSVQESYDLVRRIYQEALAEGLAEDDLIADFTGGVKPMSAGMILACRERRPMQYMYGRKKGVASEPRLVEFAPRRGRRR